MRSERVLTVVSSVRYVSLVAVASAFLGSLAMFYLGAKKTVMSLFFLVTNTRPADADKDLDIAAVVTTYLFRALDSFLFALFLLFVGFGIYVLFVSKDEPSMHASLPKALVPQSLAVLKHNLAVVIVILLFVLFLELAWGAFQSLNNKTWELLVIPVSIALLALALRLLRLDVEDKQGGE